MGRNKNTRTVCDAMHRAIDSKLKFGESRYLAKFAQKQNYIRENGTLRGHNHSRTPGIHSLRTAEAYRQTANEFARFLKDNGLKRVTEAREIPRQLCIDYLKQRAEKYSSWTAKKDMAALNKITDHQLTAKECNIQKRSLEDITRSRSGQNLNKYNPANYRDQISLSQACGMRRESVLRVTPNNFQRDEKGLVKSIYLREKGGRERIAPILAEKQEQVTEIVNNSIINKGMNETLFDKYSKNINNHDFRAQYATALYKELSEQSEELKSDYRGYDSDIIREVSEALGHSRLDVVVSHYLR